MAFVSTHSVRFPDIDRAGIVYFPRYMDFFHRAFEDFFLPEIGIPYHSLVDDPGIAFPVVHMESDFTAPLQHGDQVSIELTAARIGERSLTVRFRTFRAAREQPVATTLITFACIDNRTWKATPLPDRIRAAFQRHVEP